MKAIRCCGLELGRLPSAGVYQRWTFDVKRQARETGLDIPRLPGTTAVYRFYKPWQRAIAAAGISEAELANARVTRVLRLARLDAMPQGPHEAFAAADPSALAEIGIDVIRQRFLAKSGFALVPLSEGIKLAQLLGGSIDWLAGLDPQPGQPPAATTATFDQAALDRLLDDGKVGAAELRRRLELAVGPWRQLRSGKREPLLYELAVIAQAAKSQVDDLLRTEFPVNALGQPQPGTSPRS